MKIGVFGGTFDPIHKAHIALADYAVKELGLDELFFLPAYISPFKMFKETESAQDRYNMIKLVLHYNDAFKVSDYELLKKGPSYTIDTLEYFYNKYNCDIYFILGYDSLIQIDKWYRGEQILRNFYLVSAKRPGTTIKDANNKIKEFQSKYNARIKILAMPEMNIASTVIRERISNGLPISEYVTPEVEEYIIDNKLYR